MLRKMTRESSSISTQREIDLWALKIDSKPTLLPNIAWVVTRYLRDG